MALWGKQDAAALSAGTTIGVTNGSTAVTGSSTAFTTDIKSGDTLLIAYNLASPAIAGTGAAGNFSCTATILAVGMYVYVSGTNSGTGTITGYTSPKAYKISVTNGTTTFTLVNLDGTAIVTSATNGGTFTGLTFRIETKNRVATLTSATALVLADNYPGPTDASVAVASVAVQQQPKYVYQDAGASEGGYGPGRSALIEVVGIDATEQKVTGNKVGASPGWQRRVVLTGGKAGRVQVETLVAGRSLITGDAADDAIAADS